MAMFDDPRRELERLHQQLLEEEDEELDELIEEYGEEDYEEFFQEDYREEYGQAPFYRNFSNRYGANVRNFANGYRGEALLDEEETVDDWDVENGEPYALFPEDRRERRRRLRREKAAAKAGARAPKKGTGGLKLILILETMGILAILIWWVVTLW